MISLVVTTAESVSLFASVQVRCNCCNFSPRDGKRFQHMVLQWKAPLSNLEGSFLSGNLLIIFCKSYVFVYGPVGLCCNNRS